MDRDFTQNNEKGIGSVIKIIKEILFLIPFIVISGCAAGWNLMKLVEQFKQYCETKHLKKRWINWLECSGLFFRICFIAGFIKLMFLLCAYPLEVK